MNINSFFTQKFLFEINRVSIEPVDKFFLMFGGMLVILAAIFKLASVYAPSPVDAKYRARLFSVFLTIGLMEVFWFGARYQFIRFFGSHFIALLILAVGLVWFGMVLVKMLKNYKTEKAEWEKEQLRQKYLPQQ